MEFVTSVPASRVKFRTRVQCASSCMVDYMELFLKPKKTLPGGWVVLLPSINYIPFYIVIPVGGMIVISVFDRVGGFGGNMIFGNFPPMFV